ncbi:MAG: hypothetical protein IIA61_01685 [Candidatus Marinimicrobia bacterium]|nr:hypothetical protein [Candidatus Neomarinimicrobiota bacterium]
MKGAEFAKCMIIGIGFTTLFTCTAAPIPSPVEATLTPIMEKETVTHSQVPANPPTPGLHAYTQGHAKHQNPPDLLGGPLTVKVTQKDGSTRLALPGPRFMDPSVFGTPDNPTGFDPAPFPLLGVAVEMRKTSEGKYTFVDHATPFSDWREVGVGSVNMTVVDATAIDGARTMDKIDFEATFELPDGNKYRVTCNKPLPHGMAFPFFGGVVTNHLIHGGTGIGSRLMPTEFTYVAFWGVGNVYKNGKLINEDHMIHVMVTEIVRGEGWKLQFDGGVGDPPQGITMHLMIPPYKPTREGMKNSPLKTMFMPFPYVKKNIMADMEAAKKAGDSERVARLMEIKELMGHTKEHVLHATHELKEGEKGKMYGMPFIHIMFGNIEIEASR